MNPEREYRLLLSTGMFWEFYPELTGFWKYDKDVFTDIITRLNEEYPERVGSIKKDKDEPKRKE